MHATLELVACCPAAESEHGTLSANAHDVRCRVSGLIQDAVGSPCVDPDGYPRCSVWRSEKERVWRVGHVNRATKMINSGSGLWE